MSHNIVVPGGTTVRLPTAGKYCDRDIVVTAEGGGLSLDVVTASALPSAVVDGQIVVITETAAGTVYIDTDEPAIPAAGDLWIRLEAGTKHVLTLSEKQPYVNCGLSHVYLWQGEAWKIIDAYIGKDNAWEQFSQDMPSYGIPLNDMTWAEISKVSTAGLARTYFSVGDAKQITLNGTVGVTTFSNLTVWAFIVGFDHNGDLEGKNRIHFQIAKNAQVSGENICLVDSKYGSATGSSGYFHMNDTATNAGGWGAALMRSNLLGSTSDPSEPRANSLMASMSEDLRAVLKPATKYSNNSGAGTTENQISATTDYLWVPSVFEVLGTTTNSNPFESEYQQQYEYYASGNSKVHYKHNAQSKAARWYTRSPHTTATNYFAFINESGASVTAPARDCYGITPMFCV